MPLIAALAFFAFPFLIPIPLFFFLLALCYVVWLVWTISG